MWKGKRMTPRGKTKILPSGKFVNVLVEPNVVTHQPDITVYGPFDTAEEANSERRDLLSEMPGLSGKILQRRARIYTLPTLEWASAQRGSGIKFGQQKAV